MASKRTIKRIILTAIWSVISGGVVTLLVAANGRQQQHRCADVRINVKGTGDRFYISKSDIAFLLCANGEPTLKGMPVQQVDLARLERRLEGQSWIRDAELYFDRADVLHVTVTERQPIARVFATNGTSFYIDSSGARLPLLAHISARVPVITNYPAATRPLAKDSAVLQQVRSLVQTIGADTFWSAQLAQVDITPLGNFELLPTVGNHVIRIGNADSLQGKLDRLMLFYKQVLNKAGFDKYGVLDVQYAGQVVAMHRGADAAVDSARLKRNISELLHADQMMAAHEAAAAVADKNAPATDSVAKVVSTAAAADLGPVPAPVVKAAPVAAPAKPKPAPEKKEAAPKPKPKKETRKAPVKKTPAKQEPRKKQPAAKTPVRKEKQQPKAVMKKKN